jgi:hypothetical protein
MPETTPAQNPSPKSPAELAAGLPGLLEDAESVAEHLKALADGREPKATPAQALTQAEQLAAGLDEFCAALENVNRPHALSEFVTVLSGMCDSADAMTAHLKALAERREPEHELEDMVEWAEDLCADLATLGGESNQ